MTSLLPTENRFNISIEQSGTICRKSVYGKQIKLVEKKNYHYQKGQCGNLISLFFEF